ncbi:MAG: S8 family peptidase, partial [Pirellulaceae bacterium]
MKKRLLRARRARQQFLRHSFFRDASQGLEHLEERRLLSATPLTNDHTPGSTWFQTVADLSDVSQRPAGHIFAASGTSQASPTSFEDTSRWIVQLTQDAIDSYPQPSETTALFSGTELEVLYGLGLPGQIYISADCTPTGEAIHFLENNPLVRHFEPDVIMLGQDTDPPQTFPNDWNDRLFGMHNTGQAGGVIDADIDAPEAWHVETGSRDVVVAVIDSGIDYNHPDLAANIWTNPGEIPGNLVDDDNNGFVDDVHGWDFRNNVADPMDDVGHGTHVAGIIGAVGNNNLGIAGIAWQTSLMPLKFLGEGNAGYTSDAIRAINYATMMRTEYDVNVKVSNNSWNTDHTSVSLYEAVQASSAADILFVAAAGNGAISGRNIDHAPSYPPAYDVNNMITVAASQQHDFLARFSHYGPDTVDLAAPGSNVYSTYPLNQEAFGYDSGTSMAVPHVAGTAALLWSHLPDATVAEVRSAILAGVDHIPALTGKVGTGGRLNVLGALTVDTYAPRVTLDAPGNVTAPTETHPLTVRYRDNQLLQRATIDANDLHVRRAGENLPLAVSVKS